MTALSSSVLSRLLIVGAIFLMSAAGNKIPNDSGVVEYMESRRRSRAVEHPPVGRKRSQFPIRRQPVDHRRLSKPASAPSF